MLTLLAALLNNTLWIVGGLDIGTNDSGASPCMSTDTGIKWFEDLLRFLFAQALNLTSIDLANAFSIPSSFTALMQPQNPEIPLISNGTLWSNEIDTFWLFGGESSGQTDHDNTLWRFNSSSEGQQWAQIDRASANLTGSRPANGAGCNVPSRFEGYYLGGMTQNTTSSEIEYFHSMTKFNMNTEKTSVFDVPSYVPIIGQNLVFLSAGEEGILIAIGGYTESNDVLERVSMMDG